MPKKISPPPIPDTHRILKRMLGCKWSFSVFPLLREGVNRPGMIERRIEGISAKVLGECLQKNVSLGILEKKVFPEIPPRVEYHFTDFGRRFLEVFSVVESFQADIDASRAKAKAAKTERPQKTRKSSANDEPNPPEDLSTTRPPPGKVVDRSLQAESDAK